MLKITKDTWIISDTHFGHYNMIKFCGRPLNFNERLIEKWNKTVKDGDDILHLGDLSIWRGPTSNMWAAEAARLSGTKWLIKGNHDKGDNFPGFTVVPEQYVEIDGKRILLSHEPKDKEDWWDLNIHGHLHGNNNSRGDYPFSLDYHKDVGVDVVGYKPIRFGELI
jgi:calcineurin-like phosphoesterase family protein